MEDIFTRIYETKEWGNNNNNEYNGSSGCGSEIDYNIKTYIPFLKHFIISNKINSVVDLGCGDFKCGPLIYDDISVSYTGYDAYKKMVDYNSKSHLSSKYKFLHLDFYKDKHEIVNGDLCILKDVLQHWTLAKIYDFLDFLVENKKFKYILICNCSNQTKDNTDILTGNFRPLSSNFLPLKKYNPKKIFNYNSKELSIIIVN